MAPCYNQLTDNRSRSSLKANKKKKERKKLLEMRREFQFIYRFRQNSKPELSALGEDCQPIIKAANQRTYQVSCLELTMADVCVLWNLLFGARDPVIKIKYLLDFRESIQPACISSRIKSDNTTTVYKELQMNQRIPVMDIHKV